MTARPAQLLRNVSGLGGGGGGEALVNVKHIRPESSNKNRIVEVRRQTMLVGTVPLHYGPWDSSGPAPVAHLSQVSHARRLPHPLPLPLALRHPAALHTAQT